MVGAGAVVTRDVPPFAVVVGNPARISGYVNAGGETVQGTPIAVADAPSLPGGARRVRLGRVPDLRGRLTVGEIGRHLPFVPRRFFFVDAVPSREIRGEHAHHVCEQFLVAVTGSVHVLVDDGASRAEVVLKSSEWGLHLPAMVWGVQYKYSSDAVLLVLASHEYDGDDYIRSYADYQRLVGSIPSGGGERP